MISNEELFALIRKNPIAAGSLVAAVLFGVGIYFRGGQIPETQELLDQRAIEGRRIGMNVRFAAHLTDQLQTVNDAIAQIQPRLVRADELANNLQYFYKLEADTGVKLTELRQLGGSTAAGSAAKAPKTAFGTVSFAVSVQGEYLALLDFLRKLENGTHYSRVTLASASVISPDRTGPLSLQLTVELLGQP